jgi:hypothetical protein
LLAGTKRFQFSAMIEEIDWYDSFTLKDLTNEGESYQIEE